MSEYIIIPSAEREVEQILDYTIANHGPDQMIKYRNQLIICIENLASDNGLYRTIRRKKKILRYVHCHKHYIFAMERKNQAIHIIALYHEKMDVMTRIEKKLKEL